MYNYRTCDNRRGFIWCRRIYWRVFVATNSGGRSAEKWSTPQERQRFLERIAMFAKHMSVSEWAVALLKYSEICGRAFRKQFPKNSREKPSKRTAGFKTPFFSVYNTFRAKTNFVGNEIHLQENCPLFFLRISREEKYSDPWRKTIRKVTSAEANQICFPIDLPETWSLLHHLVSAWDYLAAVRDTMVINCVFLVRSFRFSMPVRNTNKAYLLSMHFRCFPVKFGD